MLCGETTYSRDQITEILTDDGFVVGTNEYTKEKMKRFSPSGIPGTYIENPDWEPPKKAAVG